MFFAQPGLRIRHTPIVSQHSNEYKENHVSNSFCIPHRGYMYEMPRQLHYPCHLLQHNTYKTRQIKKPRQVKTNIFLCVTTILQVMRVGRIFPLILRRGFVRHETFVRAKKYATMAFLAWRRLMSLGAGKWMVGVKSYGFCIVSYDANVEQRQVFAS